MYYGTMTLYYSCRLQGAESLRATVFSTLPLFQQEKGGGGGGPNFDEKTGPNGAKKLFPKKDTFWPPNQSGIFKVASAQRCAIRRGAV